MRLLPTTLPPEGVEGEQPAFLNAALIGETPLSARDVLDALIAIEAERGRERPFTGRLGRSTSIWCCLAIRLSMSRA